ncbi:nucleotidyltransferase domain-containing protein [Pseudonocardia nigra]|uniref:nucleotidyltransferase domain-containing protein n=1 Tax=Pseudonocardia nigra TaxID=1921578 RepID=UPI001C5F5DFF|nr:nucleotidyltransferase domain-containing protein [Pseudonocardia nigra]
MDEPTLRQLAGRLVRVPGVVGVMLGGSRARGDHAADSDVDLGLYYQDDLDVDALGALARDVAGPGARVTGRGEWGPWVDGGGWLRIDGTAVDWIYRDLARVRSSWAAARDSRYDFHQQVGHPLGVPDFAYAGEVALGVVLADPDGTLTALRAELQDYPDALGDALVAGLWEADFLLDLARKAMSRADTTYVAGCLFRVVTICAHALHGSAGRWLVTAAARLPGAPPRFGDRARHVLGSLGTEPGQLQGAIDRAGELVRATAEACAGAPHRPGDSPNSSRSAAT